MRASHQWDSCPHKRSLRARCVNAAAGGISEPDSPHRDPIYWCLDLGFTVSRTESYRLLLLTQSGVSCWSSPNGPKQLMNWDCSTAQLVPVDLAKYCALLGFSSDFYALVPLMKPPDPPPPFSFFLPALSLS